MPIDLSKIQIKPVQVFYLKMETDPIIRLLDHPALTFDELKKPIETGRYLFFYESVGLDMSWLDRLVMPAHELSHKINAKNVHIFVMYINDDPAGFLELVVESDYTEILYFGLLPKYIGKGWGKLFLNWCISKAWSYKPKWIQLNTCELDHKNALSVYRSLGFRDYKTQVEERRVIV